MFFFVVVVVVLFFKVEEVVSGTFSIFDPSTFGSEYSRPTFLVVDRL